MKLGLTKLAGIREEFANWKAGFDDEVDDAFAKRRLSTDQVNKLTQHLKDTYGLQPEFHNLESTGSDDFSGLFAPPQEIDPSIGEHGRVLASPLEETILHEMGHAHDYMHNPERMMRNMKWAGRGRFGPSLSFYGGAIIPATVKSDEHPVATALAGAGVGVGSGLGLTYLGNRARNQNEDAANDFVKRVWADQNGGNVAEAERRFAESTNPSARKSYDMMAKSHGRMALVGGVAGAGIGLALAAKHYHDRQRKLADKAHPIAARHLDTSAAMQ